MMRTLIEAVYFWTARLMPLWWHWQWRYVMGARFYFENCKQPVFSGWPWRWTMNWDAKGEENNG